MLHLIDSMLHLLHILFYVTPATHSTTWITLDIHAAGGSPAGPEHPTPDNILESQAQIFTFTEKPRPAVLVEHSFFVHDLDLL